MIIMYFISSPAAIVVVSSIFMGAVNAGLSVHNTCAINLFPTSIRYSISTHPDVLFQYLSFQGNGRMPKLSIRPSVCRAQQPGVWTFN